MPTAFTKKYMEYVKQTFNIKIIKDKIKFCNDREKSSPITKQRTFKVYVFKKDEEVWYIGITSQRISARFRLGMKGSKGYSGYKFKDKVGETLQLLVFTFDDSNYIRKYEKRKDNKKILTKEYKTLQQKFETIEGELVFEYKKNKEKWPKYQHEIHFRNNDNAEIIKIVNEIYKDIMN